MKWTDVLGPLLAGEALERDQAAWAMKRIMTGEATSAQFGAFVGALRTKGETVDEIVGMASVMRSLGEKVEVSGPLIDTCGTGGDRAGTINVSTLAGLVAAGAGARVAKHGNRAASSSCGSADLLEALGVNIDAAPAVVARCIDEAGIGFMFAPRFHPAMKHAAPLRKELGVPTTFNFLGPLTNPAGVLNQTIGVSDAKMAPKMAEALKELGSERVLVFRGLDGLDEITTTGPTQTWTLSGGVLSEGTIEPVQLGLEAASPDQLKGGSVAKNAEIAREVLAGKPGPPRDIVVINAAAALLIAGLVDDLAAGVELSADSIDSGKAKSSVEQLAKVSNSS